MLNTMNPYIISWAVIITDNKVPDLKYFNSTDRVRFTRYGANSLLCAAKNKDRALELAMATMYRYKLTGSILTITDKQFGMAQFIYPDQPDRIADLKKLRLKYNLTICADSYKLIIPITAKQISNSVKITAAGTITSKNIVKPSTL